MVADESCDTSPSAGIHTGAANRARKALAVIAFSYLGVTCIAFLIVGAMGFADGPQAAVSSLRWLLPSNRFSR